MTSAGDWQLTDTNTHQDHVIAHVVGTTVVGYFIFDEALHVLLDIGFVWTIFLDGEMALLPHPVAIKELAVDEQTRQQIQIEVDLLLSNKEADSLLHLRVPAVRCEIKNVLFFGNDDQRRLLIEGEEANLAIETSLTTAEIKLYEC